MPKRPLIVLASVLKPTDDPRMYEKIGSTLHANGYDVHLIGRSTYKKPSAPRQPLPAAPTLVPLHTSAGTPLPRWRASFFVAKQLRALRPALFVVHAPELLPVALLMRIWQHTPFIYDARENYWRNIRYQPHYPRFVRPLLAAAVRLIERLALRAAKGVWVAEKGYLHEMPYLAQQKRPALVLENKWQALEVTPKKTHTCQLPLHFICMGTLSRPFGTDLALQWVLRAREMGYAVSLTLVGQVVEKALHAELAAAAHTHSFIRLLVRKTHVPHRKIVAELLRADVALLPYPPNRSTENCIPTKLYECIALRVPMLVQHNPLWESLCARHQAAVFTDFQTAEPSAALVQLLAQKFYTKSTVEEVLWEGEARRLLAEMRTLCP